jgi:small subunit ribosomal protein S16
MLRIRLRRTGKKHQPHYRIVVAEHTAPVSGKYVSVVGHYNPRSKELVIDDAEVTSWLNNGAQPSNTIAKLLAKKGLTHKLIKIHKYPERPGKNVKPEAVATAEIAPENSETQKTEEVIEANTEIVEATEEPTEKTEDTPSTETQKE